MCRRSSLYSRHVILSQSVQLWHNYPHPFMALPLSLLPLEAVTRNVFGGGGLRPFSSFSFPLLPSFFLSFLRLQVAAQILLSDLAPLSG